MKRVDYTYNSNGYVVIKVTTRFAKKIIYGMQCYAEDTISRHRDFDDARDLLNESHSIEEVIKEIEQGEKDGTEES